MSVSILTPLYMGQMQYENVAALLVLQEELQKQGMKYEIIINPHNPYLSRTRNELAAAFYRSNAEVALWIDSDIGYGPEAAFKLLERPEEVVAGIYPKKTENLQFPVEIHTEDDIPIGRDGLIQAHRIPFGFVKTHRNVFQTLIDAYPDIAYTSRDEKGEETPEWDFFPCGLENGRWVGEDYGFSQLWTKIGGEMWIEPDITFVHKGAKGFIANYDRYLRELPKP